jgi:hypothetical protein
MIREISRCPYCGSVLAFDDERRGIVYDPDRVSRGACPHLALASVLVEAMCEMPDGESVPAPEHTCSLVFCQGEGWQVGQEGPFADYVVYLVCGDHPDQYLPPVKHQIVGANALEREEMTAGSGYFRIPCKDHTITAGFYAWGVYSRTPRALVEEVQRKVAA